MTIKERLIVFIKSEGMSICEFERRISAGNGYVSRIKNGIKPERLNEISLKFPRLNIEWLLQGNGEMLQNADKMQEMQETYATLPPKQMQTAQLAKLDVKNVIKVMANDLDQQQQTINNQQQTINEYRKLLGDLYK